jgi:hypothetical protein
MLSLGERLDDLHDNKAYSGFKGAKNNHVKKDAMYRHLFGCPPIASLIQ